MYSALYSTADKYSFQNLLYKKKYTAKKTKKTSGMPLVIYPVMYKVPESHT